jgi:hypothetical protein
MKILYNTIFICKLMVVLPLIAVGAVLVALGGLMLSLADHIIGKNNYQVNPRARAS